MEFHGAILFFREYKFSEASVQRLVTNPRNNWKELLEEQGFTWHHVRDEIYWTEGTYYSFKMPEVLAIETATAKLQAMCLQAVQHVIDNKLYSRLHIPEWVVPAIEKSWDQDKPISLYGRFDLGYNPETGDIKMLEYNADTPTSLLESAVIQWYWKEDVFPAADQFNSIHEKLVAAWARQMQVTGVKYFHFTSVESEEDQYTVEYLAECARQAGAEGTKFLFIGDIGWNSRTSRFVDTMGLNINACFKLYPYEWMVEEEFGPKMLETHTLWIEPYWKMILSNKAILPILWELFPGNKYLLAADTKPLTGMDYVSKPIFSREGANVTIYDKENKVVEFSDGKYSDCDLIYQERFHFVPVDGKYPIIGSWIIDGEPAGMCVRESDNLITNNLSRFIPHVIE